MKHGSFTRLSIKRTLVTGTVLVALSLTGCTAASQNTSGSSPQKLISMAPAAKGPVDSIVWNLPGGEPATIDPPNAATLSGAGVVSNLCDSLLTHDANYDVVPGLAEAKVISPTEITYTIRPDATFWDGNPVTAEDVAYSLKRGADPEALVSFIYASVKSIDVTGDRQVTVTFTTPNEMFNAEMTTFAGAVMEKQFTEAAGKDVGTATGGLMCSGPFKLGKWVAGDSITMTRNDSYWDKARLPLAKTVKFTFVTDSSSYTQAMAAGEIDGSYEIAPAAIPVLEKSKVGTLYQGPSMQSVGLAVAQPDGPLADIKLRTAFQNLLDRAAIAKVIYHGAATPMYTVLAPATWQNAAKKTYAAAYEPFVKARAYDVKKAKALVAASTYKGQTIVVAIPAGDETMSTLAQLIQQQAKAAGITVSIDALQPLDYAAAGYDPTKRTGIDMILGSSFNGVQDPMEPTGFDYLPGAFYNYTNFDNAEVTSLINKSLASFDAQQRADYWVQIQKLTEAKSILIPIVSTNTVTFINNRLGGAVTSFAYLTMPALTSVGSSK